MASETTSASAYFYLCQRLVLSRDSSTKSLVIRLRGEEARRDAYHEERVFSSRCAIFSAENLDCNVTLVPYRDLRI
jgi:hypothetical protein